MEYNPLYDADKGFNVMPSSMEYMIWKKVVTFENLNRVDIGTSDSLLHWLTVLSSEQDPFFNWFNILHKKNNKIYVGYLSGIWGYNR